MDIVTEKDAESMPMLRIIDKVHSFFHLMP